MSNILVILGKESNDFAKGEYNAGLFEAALEHLRKNHSVDSTVIEEGFDADVEYKKFTDADVILYQYPVYWFMMPPMLKSYIDTVYGYDRFFTFNDGPYGSGGLMKGKRFMLSTTWNAPADAFGGEFFDGAERDDVLMPMRKSQRYCGMEELPHFSCHDVVKNPNFEEDKIRLLKHLDSVLGN